ncbi:MAG: EF-hand domain-containing protein [Gammaproteobacteria bacterium]
MLRVLYAVPTALLWLACGVVAEPLYPHAGTPTRWFLSLDRNHDGYLDPAELHLKPGWARALAAADQNRDGRIDHSEFLSLLDRMHTRR